MLDEYYLVRGWDENGIRRKERIAKLGLEDIQAYLSAVSIVDPLVEDRRAPIILKGEIPSPLNPLSGCVFHPRCFEARGECSREGPVFLRSARNAKRLSVWG
jgi:oligopeptide/dipeptide ABC transporter ATP-binding protein